MYQCKHPDCAYHCAFTETCDYYLITGRRRESPAHRCGRYKPLSADSAPVSVESAADEALLQALYDAGLTDRQIAGELHLPLQAVSTWRRRQHLPSRQELLYA